MAEGSGIWTPPGGSADPGRGDEPPRPPEQETLTPEQLVEAIRQMKVADVLMSSFMTIAQLAYAKLEPSARDLEQAKLAIESLRAIAPVLEGNVPPETTRDFNQLVGNLQLAYASAASEPDTAEDQTSRPVPPGAAEGAGDDA